MDIVRAGVSRSDLEFPLPFFFSFDYVYSFVLHKERSQLIARTALLRLCAHACTFLRALSFLRGRAQRHTHGALPIAASEELLHRAFVPAGDTLP